MGDARLLRVTAHLLTPVTASDPLHLDAILHAAWTRRHAKTGAYGLTRRSQQVIHSRLPLLRHGAVWACSAWIWPPEMEIRRTRMSGRKDPADIWHHAGRHVYGSGPGRDICRPVTLCVAPSVSWLACGDRRGVRDAIKAVDAIGGLRGHGYGRVERWEIKTIGAPDTARAVHDGQRALRHLPESACSWAERTEHGAVMPPYWHPSSRRSRVPEGTRCLLCP